MKNINADSFKIAIVATTAVMVYFASGIATIAQSAPLLKAEPIKNITLVADAKASLAIELETLTIDNQSTTKTIDGMLVKQKANAKNNPTVSLSKTLIAD